jgi:hypothetical protein
MTVVSRYTFAARALNQHQFVPATATTPAVPSIFRNLYEPRARPLVEPFRPASRYELDVSEH